jgi:putative multiple sugar transport system permease protein
MDNMNLFFKKLPWRTHKYFLTLISMFRTNIRDYGMYIALSVIFLTFGVMTNFVFLAPINFTNLLNQTAYVSVLAVGMTLVIVTRQIDLSVGYIGAFLGAYVVVAVENQAQPVLVALLGALAITVFVGIVKGYFVAKIKVPSFVVTLAGMFIFKGFLMLKTGNRTIPTANIFFQKVGIGYLPTIDVNGNDMITLGIGIILLLAVIFSGVMGRKKNSKVGIPNEKIELFITKLVFMSAVISYLSWTLSSHKGISFLLLITVVVVVIYHFLTTQTTLGRRIYAVGGNPDAAELSGISVERTLIIVFISMGILALRSGVMYASRLQNTSPNHGPFWELYAIAAAFIGGTSASGGVGKVVNAVIGSIVIMSLKNGMALSGVDANIEPIILGSVLLLAVVFDIYTRNVRPIDLVGIHYAKKEFKEELNLAKIEYDKAKLELKNAKKANAEDLIEYEYKVTNTQGTFNKIKDKIRVAQEEDFIKS